jgi:predicted MFS family arabinose efflux permease
MSGRKKSLIALDWLNFFLADIRYGIGGFLAIYLLSVLKWDPAQIGLALSIPSITTVIFQSPVGAFVDYTRHKQLLVAIACLVLATCCISMAFLTGMFYILMVQAIIGIVTTIYTPAITAITLGLVGNQQFPRRMGRNETINHTGNVIITMLAGIIGYYISYAGIYYLMTALCLLSGIIVLMIPEKEIDHAVARESEKIDEKEKVVSILSLLTERNILFYTLSVVLFYFANAAMFPLLGQILSIGRQTTAAIYNAAGITIAELIMIPAAALTGYAASKGNRKYLFIIAFTILPVRGILYTFTDNPHLLLSIQTLDGAAAGIVKVISVIMIADLTKGTGRFNFMQGTVVTAIGIGTSMSDYITGNIVKHHGYHAGFIFLSIMAVVGLCFFSFWMPETKNIRKLYN